MSCIPDAILKKDLYQVLGVKQYATRGEIIKAYRKIALTSHPDKTKGIPESERVQLTEIFVAANEAYDVLTQQRDAYDYQRSHEGKGWQSGNTKNTSSEATDSDLGPPSPPSQNDGLGGLRYSEMGEPPHSNTIAREKMEVWEHQVTDFERSVKELNDINKANVEKGKGNSQGRKSKFEGYKVDFANVGK